jgi:hypothetical protein
VIRSIRYIRVRGCSAPPRTAVELRHEEPSSPDTGFEAVEPGHAASWSVGLVACAMQRARYDARCTRVESAHEVRYSSNPSSRAACA